MKSQNVALLGEAPPLVHVEPPPTRANSWEDVADLSAQAGILLDGWQELILRSAMGERTDGTWAAKRVGISVPRQNGKSQLLVSRALAGALLFGERKIIISAHQQDTARESFGKMMEIIESEENAWLRERIPKNGIMQAINREAIKFTTGATIQFKARSGAGGKGFSSDCLLLDEAQILGSRAWTSINSTMSAMPNPQVWLLGTPPQEEDDSYTFEMVRKAALGGKSSAMAWLEWSADRNSPDYDPATEYTRWSANPAWNTRMNHEVVQGEYETYAPDRFAQDRLGEWSDEDGNNLRAISSADWSATGVDSPPADGVKALGIKFSADGSKVAVAGAIRPLEGAAHFELIGAHTGSTKSGISSLATWITERWRNYGVIVIDGKSHAGTLVHMLAEAGVSKKAVISTNWGEVVTANTMMTDSLESRTATHLLSDGQSMLDDSVAASSRKIRDGGAWSFQSFKEPGDEIPIAAASLALWGAKTTKRNPARKQTASY